MQVLELEIKQLLIDAANLEDMTPEDIDTQAPIFGDGLGLDSIDALEIGMQLQRRYGVTLSADASESRSYFANVASLAQFVAANRTDKTS